MQTAGIQKAENGAALAVVDRGAGRPAQIVARQQQLSLGEMRELGEIFVASKMFKDVESVAQAVVKIKAGQELGFEPFVSMGGVHIIQGKAVLSATLKASVIKDSGRYRYDVQRLDDKGCLLYFYELVGGEWRKCGESSFGPEDAKAAKLTSEMYSKYPRNMYFSRALTNGMSWYCPDLLRCADGNNDAEAAVFDVDQVISETAGDADEGVRVPTEHVDGEIVDETKTPEQLRAEKVEHVQNLCKWLNEHKDSIEWKASTLANYVNQMFDVDDGIRSLDFESLDKLIADLTERLGGLSKTEEA